MILVAAVIPTPRLRIFFDFPSFYIKDLMGDYGEFNLQIQNSSHNNLKILTNQDIIFQAISPSGR